MNNIEIRFPFSKSTDQNARKPAGPLPKKFVCYQMVLVLCFICWAIIFITRLYTFVNYATTDNLKMILVGYMSVPAVLCIIDVVYTWLFIKKGFLAK